MRRRRVRTGPFLMSASPLSACVSHQHAWLGLTQGESACGSAPMARLVIVPDDHRAFVVQSGECPLRSSFNGHLCSELESHAAF